MATSVPKRVPSKSAVLVLLALLASCGTPRPILDDSDWRLYQQRFISPDGRVIDTGNGQISHSEGQGFGMLLAVAYRDRQTFDRLWHWTAQNLQVRDDKLFAWRWTPTDGGGAVSDLNNASDGDILIAWALCRAGIVWTEPAYSAAASTISQEIRGKLVWHNTHATYLLPGATGFEKPTGTTVNLSYWIFPAFAQLQQLDPAPVWEQLTQSGLALLHTARFGRWQLPPDWLDLQQPPVLTPEFPPVFGYNALRIPLYLLWAKQETFYMLQPYVDFWTYFDGARFTPAWTNLRDNSVDSYDALAGVHAIAAFTKAVATQPASQPPRLPSLDSEQDYYSASLLLLTKVAVVERGWP